MLLRIRKINVLAFSVAIMPINTCVMVHIEIRFHWSRAVILKFFGIFRHNENEAETRKPNGVLMYVTDERIIYSSAVENINFKDIIHKRSARNT